MVRPRTPGAANAVSCGLRRSPAKIVPSVVEVTKNRDVPGSRAMPSGNVSSPGMVYDPGRELVPVCATAVVVAATASDAASRDRTGRRRILDVSPGRP